MIPGLRITEVSPLLLLLWFVICNGILYNTRREDFVYHGLFTDWSRDRPTAGLFDRPRDRPTAAMRKPADDYDDSVYA